MAARNGLILAGAVGKGAFHAGALAVMSERQDVVSLVGTSAGALSAAVYAAGVTSGHVRRAAQVIEQLWLQDAHWTGFVSPNLQDLLSLQGLSDTGRVEKMLRAAISEVLGASGSPDRDPNPAVEVSFVATDLKGHLDELPGGPRHTTFEAVFTFNGADYQRSERIEHIVAAAAASAAFPLLFAPREIATPQVEAAPGGRTRLRIAAEPAGAHEKRRPYIDGGAVNNTPISYAIDSKAIDRVIVVTPMPAVVESSAALGGIELVTELIDILINERLSRDLHKAARVNQRLASVEAVLREAGVDAAVQDRVRQALGWRPLDILEVRPEHELPGNAFSGFNCREYRQTYIAQGRQRAEAVLW